MTAATGLRSAYGAEVKRALAKYPPERAASAAIELLYLAQAAYGHLSAEAVEEVAEVLHLDPTHVRGLASFYSLLRERPHGGYVIHVCTDLPCALRGAEELLERLCERLGIRPGQTTADGLFTVEPVMCLAACDRAPLMQVNLEYHYDLDEAALDAILAGLRRRAAAGAGPRPPTGLGPPSEMEPGAVEDHLA